MEKLVQTSEAEIEWDIRLLGLARLWSMTRGRPEVHIAVLDGLVDKQLLSQQGLTSAYDSLRN